MPLLGQGVIDRVVALTSTKPPQEATRWTAAALAKALRISLTSVQRIWNVHDVRPRRVRHLKFSTDPASAAEPRETGRPLGLGKKHADGIMVAGLRLLGGAEEIADFH